MEESLSITKSELVKWLTRYPTLNECTHFACILDPSPESWNSSIDAQHGVVTTSSEHGPAKGIIFIKRYAEGEVNGEAGGKVKERLNRQKKNKGVGMTKKRGEKDDEDEDEEIELIEISD